MHPKIASLLPLHHLSEIKDDEYFMALSHAADNDEYLMFFRDRAAEGKYVTLDNSAVELGEPEPFEKYVEKAIGMNANQILLPDTFLEPEKTLREARKSLEFLARTRTYNPDIMVVPQGKTVLEWLQNAKDLIGLQSTYSLKRPGKVVTTLGISARYTDMFGGSRSLMTWIACRLIYQYQSVHLLGCYTDPRKEFVPVRLWSNFMGMDSSYAAVYTQQNHVMSPESLAMPRPIRHIDFLNDTYDVALLRKNLEVWWTACLG